MAFQQGLSGLNSSSKALDVISNNVANASTVGFKAGNAHFSDLYAASLSGSGASQIGIGSSMSAVVQQFTQGNITTTNNPLDISINGGGFFRMSRNDTLSYTRSGQFHLDRNGYIVNDAGLRLTGYPADGAGVVVQSTPVELQLNAADQPPLATGASVGSAFQGVRGVVNLDSREAVPDQAWTGDVSATPGEWSPDPRQYNYSTALSIYDTLGNAHTLTFYFCKEPGQGDWSVRANVDGTSDTFVTLTGGNAVTDSGGATVPGLDFDAFGELATPVPLNIQIDLAAVMAAQGLPNNALTPLEFDIDFDGSTQFGASFGTNRLEQDGYTSGRLAGLGVSADGVIQGRYSNGQSRNLGQVVLANFTNPNGLLNLGGNQWMDSSASGPALIGAPNSGSLGVLQSSSVEESNVDLTAELVSMITQQRNYQANAQSIKTQDSITQTLLNLR